MLRKFFTTTIVFASFNVLFAQDSTKTFAISGSIDAFYRYNFSNPKSGTNNFTSFTNAHNSFELGMATLRADGSALSGKVTGTADLGFGRRAEEFSYADGQLNTASGYSDLRFPLDSPYVSGKNGFLTLAAVKQLYVTYTPGKYVKFTIGKWATHVGYELLDAYANRNYSMDYMFSYGPFSHTGLKLEYAQGTTGFMIGIANPTDNATTTSTAKTLLAQFSVGSKNGAFKAYLNYQGSFSSLNKFNQVDLVLLGTVSPMFNIGYNGTIFAYKGSNNSWMGSALYFNFDPTPAVGLTLRGEYLGNKNYVLPLGTKNIFDVTFSVDCKVGPLTIIPELRFESAQSGIYTKHDGDNAKGTAAGLLAAIYKF